ncbi:MAG: amino acid permease [Ignavibacteriales bacterium]|nr:amino acid permease [Ignavibacteriales bacterium]
MAQKKFGTFGGVFTPSILTILGVIMYMRLPWIVGNAGLFITIGIILVAHVVSVTTGLSVSSIATDKKVKAGGTYYIISRSLGLPIGGTLGIALFFGLSLSVSLYLIGFSESFLGFWDIPIDKNTIRITGTIALVLVGTLTFISTSLAIKTQYFIMTAILLSLVTIIFGNHDFVPVEPLLNPIEDTAPIILLFAIFFPAVTGFEAGVSMSGDLQDPKKSIPTGTIAAIIIGLLVYIGLAVFFAFSVSSDQLINNPNILLEISFYPPLLVAGIWGATISSAIGSILGAPRILQATSLDKITPKIFGKGYGPTNEPRNALLLTFAIAEAGILIGELNLIARVVSMFFITTYGFLNISSTIEKLVSTDFRPTFKIPVWVSIIGALVSILLMLELDFIALIGAVIIMGAIFIYLKNKELTLESGDTWEGVWSSLLRSGLNRLNRTEIKQRNWRPNIILFSGGASVRPHLIEFGRWLVKKRGILSNFNLIENINAAQLIKRPQAVSKEKANQFEGIFTREIEVNDIYEGMETITKLYGFAGIEPNSVMLGWARESKDPKAFSKLLRLYQKLDYNIFILDYDKTRQFGNKKTIDLWWRGSNNNATLALTIIKFLEMDEDWDNVEVRIFIVTTDSSIHNRVYKNVNQILDDQRLHADVKIINNSIENKPIQDIIYTESMNTDLVIIGLPNVEKDFTLIENTDKIISNLNTVLLIHASSFFKSIYIGIEDSLTKLKGQTEIQLFDQKSIDNIVLPENEILAKPIIDFHQFVDQELRSFKAEYLAKITFKEIELIDNIKNLIEKNISDLKKNLDLSSSVKNKKNIARITSNFLFNTKKIIDDYQQEILPEQFDLLTVGLQSLLDNINGFNENYTSTLIHEIDLSYSKIKNSFANKIKLVFKKTKKVKINLDDLISNLTSKIEIDLLHNLIKSLAVKEYQFISDLQKLFNTEVDTLMRIETKIEKSTINDDFIKSEYEKIIEKLNELKNEIISRDDNLYYNLYNGKFNLFQDSANIIQEINVNKLIKTEQNELKSKKFIKDELYNSPTKWQKNQHLLSNFFIEDIYLKNFLNRSEIILQRFLKDIIFLIDNKYLDILEKINLQLSQINLDDKTIAIKQIDDSIFNTNEHINELTKDFNNAVEIMPDVIEIMDEESFQNLDSNQLGDAAILEINLKNYLIFLIENDIIDPLQNELNAIALKLNKTRDILLDVVRFTNYNVNQIDIENEENSELFNSILKRSSDRVESEINNINSLKKDLLLTAGKITENTFSKLNPFLISRSVGNLKHIVRVQESREFIDSVQSNFEKAKTSASKFLVDLIYRKSEGIILAKKIKDQSDVFQTETGKILSFVNKHEPDFSTLDSLPFYYKQLFLGKHFRSKEFLIERKLELEIAEKTYLNFKNGYHGALLILGERYSGKTTLSNTISNKLFNPNNIFEINAIESGSINFAEFEKQLSLSLKQDGDSKTLLNSLSSESIIIINDLELWWERSNSGFTVIKEILNLVETFSSKIFFIVNVNQYAFQLINKILPIENIFINAVHCQPFDSEEIKEAILLRHKSSGLKFELNNQMEDQLSNFKLANLFNSYFEISNGNIGTAIFTWIRQISKYYDQEITINKPEEIKNNILNNLNNDWLILLQQFIYHKYLSNDRLQRILNYSEIQAEQSIINLKRTGLINEVQNNIYQINPYVQNIISKKLVELRLL